MADGPPAGIPEERSPMDPQTVAWLKAGQETMNRVLLDVLNQVCSPALAKVPERRARRREAPAADRALHAAEGDGR